MPEPPTITEVHGWCPLNSPPGTNIQFTIPNSSSFSAADDIDGCFYLANNMPEPPTITYQVTVQIASVQSLEYIQQFLIWEKRTC